MRMNVLAEFTRLIGGGPDELASRKLRSADGWKRFTLFRRVPPSGEIQVTAALTGLGTVYFDDLKIEPLQPRP